MPTFSNGATGVPANNKQARNFFSIQFGASPSGNGGALKALLIFAAMTATGTATANTVYDLPGGVDDAILLAGPGSEGHLAVAAALTKAPAAKVQLCLIPDASGGGAASATQTLTVTAVPAPGNYALTIHGVDVVFSVGASDTVNSVATSIATAIQSSANQLCVTGVAVAAVVTITYRHIGVRGNSVKLRLRGLTVNLAAGKLTLGGVALAGGIGIDSVTTALANSSAGRFDFQVFPQTDSTNQLAIQAQMDSQAGPLAGKREQAILIGATTQSAETALAVALDDALVQYLWLVRSDTLPIVAAAAWGAIRSYQVSVDPSVNLSAYNPTVVDLFPVVAPPFAKSDQALDAEIVAALNTGMTPIATNANGHAYVARSITSHSQDSLGHADVRTLDTINVDVPFAFADDLDGQIASTYAGANVEDDPAIDADPQVGGVLTPRELKGFCFSRAERFQRPLGYLTHVEADFQTWAFNLAAGSPGRINATMAVTPVAWFVGVSANIRQLSLTS